MQKQENKIQKPQSSEIRVDFITLLSVLLKKWYMILIAGMDAGLAIILALLLFSTPDYVSNTTLLILNRESTSTVLYSDLEISTKLTNDYGRIVTSRAVLDRVIQELGLDMSCEELEKRIDVSIPYDTRMIYIYVKAESPKLAYQIANCLQTVVSDRMAEVMDIEAVNVIDYASIPVYASSPRYSLYFIAAFLAGAFLMALAISVLFVTDDRIKSPENIEELLSLSILATIPLEHTESGKRRNNQLPWRK
ncbi:MAG: Wzz/FepE/Etk N-terminal domain-containing protein [Lachnospiraceae bacterium]|nr:Wzz/FepE/Etk N-terminal domain-containing protein [Lachnospiraceae bacterium]